MLGNILSKNNGSKPLQGLGNQMNKIGLLRWF